MRERKPLTLAEIVAKLIETNAILLSACGRYWAAGRAGDSPIKPIPASIAQAWKEAREQIDAAKHPQF